MSDTAHARPATTSPATTRTAATRPAAIRTRRASAAKPTATSRTTRVMRKKSHAEPLPGPGSLVHPEARRGAACKSCNSDRLTEIGMTLTDGSRVNFIFCHVCEHRVWVEDEVALPFDRVLDKTRKIA
jgi:hypothetical protein